MRFQFLAVWLSVVIFSFASMASAQERVWIQIEAHPSQQLAKERAAAISDRLTAVEGYRLRSGWWALAIGPVSPAEAPSILRQLRVTRQIPAASYLVDGGAYGQQFWPEGGTSAQTELTLGTEATQEAPAAPVDPIPADETPAEARRAENLLTRDEKKELQTALAWEGFYNSAIDGALGRGSRRAMGDWQAAKGFEVTGVLTTSQRQQLIGDYRAVLNSIGMRKHIDDVAGIDIDIPSAMVEFDRYEPPFVHFPSRTDDGVQVVLISQSGDRVSLGALYDVMQTLRLVPLEGPRRLRRDGFSIEGTNDAIQTIVEVQLTEDGLKGFMLVWPNEIDKRRALVLGQLRNSFSPVPGAILADNYGDRAAPDVDLLAGLQIRRPDSASSGFYVSRDGKILTTAATVTSCERITIDDDIRADIAGVDEAKGLALLSPQSALSPIGIASITSDAPRPGSEIAVSGYSFGGRLNAPSLTFGRLESLTGLSGETEVRMLDINATEGDAGGPLLAASGSVLGMLLPAASGSRRLPEGTNFALASDALLGLLDQSGVEPEPASAQQSLPPEDLASLAADMTVLVSCWN